MENEVLQCATANLSMLVNLAGAWEATLADAIDLVQKVKTSRKKETALFDFVYQKFDESLGNEKSHQFFGICLDKIGLPFIYLKYCLQSINYLIKNRGAL